MEPAEARALRDGMLKTWGALKTQRSSYDAHWREIADYIQPRRSRFQIGDVTRAGSKRNDKIINNTATEAAKVQTSGMMAGMTSPARPWFVLGLPDPKLLEAPGVKPWLFSVARTLRDVMGGSNLYGALQSNYEEVGLFGTGALTVDESDETVIHATAFTVGSYALGVNSKGIADTLIREMGMSARQMAQEFGRDALSRSARQALDDPASAEASRTVLHLIGPNPDYVPGRIGRTQMPWRSVYLEQGGDDDGVLRVAGYMTRPFFAPRWDVLPDEVYGSSPAMRTLGDVKALQQLEKRKLAMLDKLTDPPMAGPPELKGQYASLIPGDITYLAKMPGGLGYEPIYVPNPVAIQMAAAEIREHERRINTAFSVDLFLSLTQSDRRQMTAREVEERHEEKLLMLGPVVERFEHELLRPLIDRVFDICWRRGLLEDPPEALQGLDVRPEFISLLAQAQRAVAVGSIERAMTFGVALAQSNPDALDKLDFDQAIDEFATATGAPPTIIRTDDAVAAIRAGRQQQQQMAQMQQMAAAAKDAALATKAASEAPVGTGSVLDQILSPSQAAA